MQELVILILFFIPVGLILLIAYWAAQSRKLVAISVKN